MDDSKIKLVISSFVALCIIAALVYVLLSIKPKKAPEQTKKPQETKQEIVRTDVDPKVLPATIPTDIPYEKNAKVIQNYTQMAGTEHQSTRIYESTKTLAASYKIFNDYFKNNGWTVMNNIDQPKLKMLFGQKDGIKLQVTMNANDTTEQNLIDVTVTY